MAKIKLAIVDDELTSRNTMKAFLESNEIYEVAADFSTGKSALEWLRKNQIDILLCDMQMPEMNGVELMRSVHIIDEYLPVIAVSGFDDFQFVRGSLINGAANYLLKHELTKESLIQSLEQVREKYRIIPEGKTITHKTGYCIYDEKEFHAERIREMSANGEIDFCCFNVVPIAISPDYKTGEGIIQSEYKYDICKAIMDMLAQMLGEKYKYLVYCTKQYHLIVLLSFANECSTLFMLNTINNLSGRLQRQIIRMLDITATIISGDVQKELSAAMKEAKRQDDLLADKFYLGGNRMILASVSKKLKYSTEHVSENLWNQLQFELDHNMGEGLGTLQNLFEIMENERYPQKEVFDNSCKILEMLCGSELLNEEEKKEIKERIKGYEFFEQYQSELLGTYKQKILNKNRKKTQYSDLVSQVITYINENYTKDISLERCAEITESSYTYLSREFKKETGMRFVEFLNRQRVNKAKSLLIRKEVSMKEIVEQSGFRNYNYFFKVFKELEGVTPSEFLANGSSAPSGK